MRIRYNIITIIDGCLLVQFETLEAAHRWLKANCNPRIKYGHGYNTWSLKENGEEVIVHVTF
jgi:hypothetical protein